MADQILTDLSYLHDMAMGDENIVIETTEVFIQSIPETLQDLKTCYAKQEWEQIGRLAHRIKPNLSYMGMHRAREVITDIEEQVNNNCISEDFGEQIKEFDELCHLAVGELTARLRELKS